MRFIKEIASWIGHIFIAAVCALLISAFVFQPTQVEGRSMESTLHDKDRVLVNKLLHTFNKLPDYGDIVIIDSRVNRPRVLVDDIADSLKYNAVTHFLFNENEEIYWIKRVIGRPGDILEFREGKVYRNGKVVEESYIKEPMRSYPRGKITVPEGHVFVMGDNRNFSKDSREIGSVPISHVVGKYILKF